MSKKLINSYSQHKGGSRSLRDSHHLSVDLTLDFLNGCEYNCSGCFVSKKNTYTDNDLNVVLDLVEQWNDNGYDVNELFLGPTDIFSAVNLEELCTNETFQKICSYFTFTCTTTLLNDYDDIKRKYELLNDKCLSDKKHREFEIFVVIDDKKYIDGDKEYLDKFNKNLELLDLYNVFFVVNVYSENMFDETSLFELNNKIFNDYGSKIRVNPSYFRGTSLKHLEKYSMFHKRLVEQQITKDNIRRVFMNMIDVYFGSYTFNAYSFSNSELYIAPLLYENIPQEYDYFKINRVNDKYTLDLLDKAQVEHFYKQIEYSKRTDSCCECEFLSSCVGRNVLSYMEHRGMTKCFLPKKWFRDASKVIEFD